MKKTFLIIMCLIILSLMTGCFAQRDVSEAREAFAQTATEDILIGIPGPISYMKDITGFHNGVMMAVDEINAAGGIRGRFIKAWVVDDKGTFNDGIRVAQEFASREEVVAVIGHWNTYITLPAARIYDDAGLVMMSPIVSNADLTKKGYHYVFQNTINDYEMGRQMADYAREKGYESIVVFYADNDYGRGLAKSFEKYVSDYGGLIVDKNTEFINEHEFNKGYNRWVAFDYDAVFIADSMPDAGEFIKRIRAKDAKIPIFAGDGLDIANLPFMLGDAAEGIVIATMYNSEHDDQLQKEFIKAYVNKYNEQPDVWAAQGYDSIKLLTYAMQKAETPSPSKIAEVLHGEIEWNGVMGAAEFNANGEITGRSIYKKTVSNSKMEYLEN